MTKPRLARTGILAAGTFVTLAMALPDAPVPSAAEAPDARGMRLGAAQLQSAGALTFGPDAVLFVADSRGGMVYALDVADAGSASFTGRTIANGLDRQVAALLGTTSDQIRFGDMARHPVSGNLYVSISRLTQAGSEPALIRITGDDRIELVDLGRIRHSSTPLPAAPPADAKTRWGQPTWTLAMTDLAFVDGQLWVAGLSNEQFASALRRLSFPFGKEGAVTTVEIFHTSHNRWETAAPIDAFLPITLDGVPSLLAGYGCSPIAVFSRTALASGKHQRGRTVAELGGGSRPIDMIRYEKEGKEWILIANSARTLMRVDPRQVASAPALTAAVEHAFEPAGVPYLSIASTGVMHIADLNPQYVAVMHRDAESGRVDIVTYDKKWL